MGYRDCAAAAAGPTTTAAISALKRLCDRKPCGPSTVQIAGMDLDQGDVKHTFPLIYLAKEGNSGREGTGARVPEADPPVSQTGPSPKKPKASWRDRIWEWPEVRRLLYVILLLFFIWGCFMVYSGCKEKKVQGILEIVEISTAENTRLEQDLSDMRVERDALRDDLDAANDLGLEMWERLDGMGYIVDGSPYYHHFTCDALMQAGAYQAHDVGSCQEMGYDPCPVCREAQTHLAGEDSGEEGGLR